MATNVDEDGAKQEPLHTVGGNVNQYNHFGKQYGYSLKTLNILLPCDPLILLLGIQLKEYESGYNEDACICMLITSLFTISKLMATTQMP
jgi:hypothetical protein